MSAQEGSLSKLLPKEPRTRTQRHARNCVGGHHQRRQEGNTKMALYIAVARTAQLSLKYARIQEAHPV